MNNVDTSLVHGKRQKVRQGLAKQSCAFALSAGLLLAAWAPLTARAESSAITQLQYLQWVAQLTGASSQFSKDTSASDYVNWAKSVGLKASDDWSPKDHLSGNDLAISLCGLFNIKAKGSSDAVRALQRAGIDVSGISGNVTKDNLVALVDQITVSARLASLGASSSKKGNSDDHPDDPKHSDDHGDKDTDNHKVTICHKGHTITVSQKALPAHLAHGDTLGKCHVTKHGHDRDDDDHHSDDHH